ncbi:MAG: rhomboid family intramembrane serine protease [Acidimicrobiia bacterium]|nr:rhomboid family intramembrane serine protease [Acidimicrobiia bacterium]
MRSPDTHDDGAVLTQPEATNREGAFPSCAWHPDVEMAVRCSRCGRPICADCAISASVGFQCPACVREGNTPGARRIRWQGQSTQAGRNGRAPVTMILIGINVVAFVLTLTAGNSIDDGALVPAAVTEGGQWWRLLTSMFLHAGLMHIAFNMFALWVLGSQLEVAIGPWWYLAVFFVAGLAGGVVYVALAAPFAPAVGASGAVFGLFGAVGVLAWRRRHTPQGRALWRNIAVLLVINLVFTFAFPGIAWQAHVGGLVAGGALMAILDLVRHPPA